MLTVTGLTPGASATITQTTSRSGYSAGTATASGSATTGAALTPTFSTGAGTASGFTVQIANHSISYTWAGSATSGGTVSISVSGLVTVTGITPGAFSAVTITTTRTGYTSGTATYTFSRATQRTLTIVETNVDYNSTLSLSTSGGDGEGAVTYVVNSGNCTVNNAVTPRTLSSTSAGNCSITATKALDNDYEAISSAAKTITVNQIAQATVSATINITSKVYPYSQAITLGASGGTGEGTFSFAIYSGGTAETCALSGIGTSNTISASTSGTCLIRATRAADTNYTSKSSSSFTFTFTRATQSALSITNSTASYGTPLTLAISGGTGDGALTYSVTSGPCTVANNTTLNYSASGTCVLTATRAEDTNYFSATSPAKSIVVSKAAVTTTVSSAADLTLVVIKAVYLKSNPIAATISVPGKVTFLANGKAIPGCTNVPSKVGTSTCAYKPVSLGTVTISATITPNDKGYLPATKTLKVIVSPK